MDTAKISKAVSQIQLMLPCLVKNATPLTAGSARRYMALAYQWALKHDRPALAVGITNAMLLLPDEWRAA